MEAVTIQKPKQIDFVDKDQRIFKVWGTVDIKDKQNERLQVRPYFDRVMPIIMKRGGVITFGHTDQQCAKILNYEIKENPETGSDGVLLTVHMFDDYDSDDRVWDGIKSGVLPAVSFKGAGVVDQFSGMDADKVVKVLEGYGFAIVDRPANPEALVTEVNYLAKSDVEKGSAENDVSRLHFNGKPYDKLTPEEQYRFDTLLQQHLSRKEKAKRPEPEWYRCPKCGISSTGGWGMESPKCPDCGGPMELEKGLLQKSTYKVVRLPDGAATLVEVQLPDGSYQIVNAKCEDYNDMNDEKKKKVDECLHKTESTEKEILNNEPSANSNQSNNGVISMENETKTETKPEFVTKEEYSALSTKVDGIARGQDAILDAIKAMQPTAKKEDEEKPEDEEKSVKKAEPVKDVAKGLGTPTAATTPRPAAPDIKAEKTNDIMKWMEQFDGLGVDKIAQVTKSLDQKEINTRTSF